MSIDRERLVESIKELGGKVESLQRMQMDTHEQQVKLASELNDIRAEFIQRSGEAPDLVTRLAFKIPIIGKILRALLK